MKSSRKLKDYPPVPSTPPPGEKKDKSLVHLQEELDHEKKYLGALCLENKELEEILQDLDKDVTYIKSNFPQQMEEPKRFAFVIAGDGKVHANNEFWFKYESQTEANRKLEREKKHLLNEIRQIEEQGMINLDSLTQSELILYVKQLERTKTDLLSDLRSKEWSLDKQAKDIHHLNEMKRTLQAEIRHYDKEFALFRHYKKTSCPSASPTRSHPSSTTEKRRLKLWKQTDASNSSEPPEERNSLSQEDIVVSDLMFSSLDESQLKRPECDSPTLGFQRKTTKPGKRVTEAKKGPARKTVVAAPTSSVPEVKTKSTTHSPKTSSKIKRTRGENKVGSDSPKQKPIKIIVTYETQTTTVTEEKLSEEKGKKAEGKGGLESFRSTDEVYEDDFEDTDGEKYQDSNVGFLTTRV